MGVPADVFKAGTRWKGVPVVDYAALRHAYAGQWTSAADDWISLAKTVAAVAQDVRAGGSAVGQNWSSPGQAPASKKVGALADELESASDIMRGVGMVLDGMAESIGLAQATLHGALDLAAKHEVHVDGNGRASSTASVATAPNGAADQHMIDEQQLADQYVGEVQALVNEALLAAGQADRETTKQLRRLQGDTGITNPSKAVDEQTEASNAELAILKDDIPSGKDPALVAAWWRSLTAKQQHDLEQAEPVALANLDGLPRAVRDRIEHSGTRGEYDRAKEVAYAQKWGRSKHGDLYDDSNQNNDIGDCTTFVSQSLAAGGMRQTGGWKGDQTGISGIDKHIHSGSWSEVGKSYQYWSHDRGHEVTEAQAQPGDIIYFQKDNGDVYHAAVVTAVTPDGDLRYAAHSNDVDGKSLDGWTSTHSDSTVHIVRPQ